MRGYSTKELSDLLISNGWVRDRNPKSHIIFTKEGCRHHISVPVKHELSRPLAQILLKEAGIL